MTDRTPDVQELESISTETKIRVRAVLSDMYSAVKSTSRAANLAAPTIGKMLQERYIELEGPSTNPMRPARLEQVRSLRAQFRAVLEQIRSMPPEAWALGRPGDEVSSSLTEEGTEPD